MAARCVAQDGPKGEPNQWAEEVLWQMPRGVSGGAGRGEARRSFRNQRSGLSPIRLDRRAGSTSDPLGFYRRRCSIGFRRHLGLELGQRAGCRVRRGSFCLEPCRGCPFRLRAAVVGGSRVRTVRAFDALRGCRNRPRRSEHRRFEVFRRALGHLSESSGVRQF